MKMRLFLLSTLVLITLVFAPSAHADDTYDRLLVKRQALQDYLVWAQANQALLTPVCDSAKNHHGRVGGVFLEDGNKIWATATQKYQKIKPTPNFVDPYTPPNLNLPIHNNGDCYMDWEQVRVELKFVEIQIANY